LENSVNRRLNALYNKKIKPYAALLPIEIFKQRHDAEVRTIIRKAVQDSYLHGTEVVNDAILAKAPDFQLFTSVTDITNIAAIAEQMTNQFWITTGKLVQREHEFVLEDDELVKKRSFDTKAAMIGIGAAAVIIAYNRSIQSKLPVALANAPLPPPPPPISTPSPSFDNAEFNIELDVPFEIRELGLTGRVRFTTKQDAEVDPKICAPLDGMEWDAGDPGIVIPVDDTHKYCRCKLIPIVESPEIG